MTTSDHDVLIRAYLDGTATPEQVGELDRLLAVDAAVRHALLAESAFDVRARQLLQREGRPGTEVGRPWRPRFARVALAAAAGAALAVGVAWYAVRTQPADRPTASTPAGGSPAGLLVPVEPAAEIVGVMTRVQGDASLISPRSRENGAAPGQNLVAAGDTLAVGSNGEAIVQYADGSRLIAHANARLSFEPSAGGKLAQLDCGAVDFEIVAQPSNRTMVVYTSRLTAEIVGTQFRLIDDGTASWLAVKSGLVRVTDNANGRQMLVGGNRYARITKGATWGPFPAATCPYWKAACKASVGDKYP